MPGLAWRISRQGSPWSEGIQMMLTAKHWIPTITLVISCMILSSKPHFLGVITPSKAGPSIIPASTASGGSDRCRVFLINLVNNVNIIKNNDNIR